MLTGRRQNFHHSKLPQPGEMGYVITGHDHYGGRRRVCIVESFP